jgi:redox-sensitive bicupin YhaK (pirin superfamily)
MGSVRRIRRVSRSKPTVEGAGVRLKRAFGFQQVPDLDPFLLLDDFHSDNPDDYVRGFPWHPHRGIETITYMLQGKVVHGDSLGNRGVIGPGDVQWMTAGSGIIHQEMPKGGPGGLMWGCQLWANLPASHKMMDPRYRDVNSSQSPVVRLEGGITVRVICGRVGDVRGPVQDVVIDPQYLDVAVPAGSIFAHPTKRGHTVFAYVLEGAACFDDRRDAQAYEVEGANYFDWEPVDCLIGQESLVVYDDGDEVRVTTQEQAVRFLLISGQPIREPVAWYGPIVMNTQDELRLAFEEYQAGTFIKRGSQPS